MQPRYFLSTLPAAPQAGRQRCLLFVLSHYSSAFAATFLYHTATLAWFGLTPTPLLASAPCHSYTSPSAFPFPPPAFNSISRVTFHCMHRFIIAKMENSAVADGFPSSVASFLALPPHSLTPGLHHIGQHTSHTLY